MFLVNKTKQKMLLLSSFYSWRETKKHYTKMPFVLLDTSGLTECICCPSSCEFKNDLIVSIRGKKGLMMNLLTYGTKEAIFYLHIFELELNLTVCKI